jgi:hypothetical protein
MLHNIPIDFITSWQLLPGNGCRRLMSNITQLSKLRNEKWENSEKKGRRKQRKA